MFELHNARKWWLGSGVAPQTPMPLYTTVSQKCFWIPRIVVFEVHNAIKWCLGSGVEPQTSIPLYPTGQQRCFWIPRMLVFEMDNARKWCLGSGVAPQHPYLCTLQASKDFLGTYEGGV